MPNLPDCAPGSCNKEGSPPGCRAKGAGSKGSPGPPRRTVPSGGVADTLDETKAAFRGPVSVCFPQKKQTRYAQPEPFC